MGCQLLVTMQYPVLVQLLPQLVYMPTFANSFKLRLNVNRQVYIKTDTQILTP